MLHRFEQPQAAKADATPESYKSGAIGVARPAPKTANELSDIPPDSVGGFVYTGGPISLSDIQTRGVRYTGSVGIELQGWLRAKEAGRYQIGTDLIARVTSGQGGAPTCFLQVWLEGHSLDQKSTPLPRPGNQETTGSLVVGADLQPGLYRLRVWSDCIVPTGTAVTSEILLKTPPELNLRALTGGDLLHKEGG